MSPVEITKNPAAYCGDALYRANSCFPFIILLVLAVIFGTHKLHYCCQYNSLRSRSGSVIFRSWDNCAGWVTPLCNRALIRSMPVRKWSCIDVRLKRRCFASVAAVNSIRQKLPSAGSLTQANHAPHRMGISSTFQLDDNGVYGNDAADGPTRL